MPGRACFHFIRGIISFTPKAYSGLWLIVFLITFLNSSLQAAVVEMPDRKLQLATRNLVGTYALFDREKNVDLTAVVRLEFGQLVFSYIQNSVVYADLIFLESYTKDRPDDEGLKHREGRVELALNEVRYTLEKSNDTRVAVESYFLKFEDGQLTYSRDRQDFKKSSGAAGRTSVTIDTSDSFPTPAKLQLNLKKISSKPLSRDELEEIALRNSHLRADEEPRQDKERAPVINLAERRWQCSVIFDKP